MTLNFSLAMLLALGSLLAESATLLGQTSKEESPIANPQPSDDGNPVAYPNWKIKTLGGKQFWTDVRYVGGWRIQANSETGHYRLLDPGSTRHASGNRTHCDQMLDQLIVDGKAKPETGKVVIILHGLMRTKSAMQPMAKYLQKNGDFTSINLQYASTRNKVGEHAIALQSVIDSLSPKVTEIDFVGHSLGNIVVRRYLGDHSNSQTGRQADPRIKRMVMLGPPNQGSGMARFLKSSFTFQTIAGVSGVELSRAWEKLEPTLATPGFEFGIIAGGQENEQKLGNFILKGRDDFTVSVEETKLAGAHDFLVRPLFHSTMMHQPEVLKATLSFLQHGYFISDQERTPLTQEYTSDDSRSGRE